MPTEDLRTALKKLLSTRGALKALAKESTVKYNTLLKFTHGKIKSPGHDFAQNVIKCLPKSEEAA
jgi:hypothetical protein